MIVHDQMLASTSPMITALTTQSACINSDTMESPPLFWLKINKSMLIPKKSIPMARYESLNGTLQPIPPVAALDGHRALQMLPSPRRSQAFHHRG